MDPALQRALGDARAGKLAAAIASVRRFLSIKPGNTDALQVLGLLLSQSGQLDQAAAQLSRAVELSPSAANLRNNYATILIQLRRFPEAAAQARKSIELNPTYIPGHIALSCALLYSPDSESAIAAARRGLELSPNHPDLSKNLILALDQSGRSDAALRTAEQAHLETPSDAGLQSLYLMLLNYTDRPATEVAAAHRRYGQLHPSSPPPPANTNPPIRVGILSADLRTHSVAHFLEPILEHLPKDFEVICFSLSASNADGTTQRFRKLAKGWHDVGHLDDASLSPRIRDQRIDILLELMGHTGGTRLVALASKPAPIIVSAIGYPNTTGLASIDYRLVDSITDPPGAESLATERLLRVDPCFLCYRPPERAPAPSMPRSGGPITFGSFNAPAKISERTASLWRGVLDCVPASRLVLKSKDLTESCARNAVMQRLAAAGVAADRIQILDAAASVHDHLSLYSTIHIALDTVPYNGTTTTCEALFMGVPVVALAGDRHASRVGMSLLSAAGHPEWIARSPSEFSTIAAALSADQGRLSDLRKSLRPQLLSSPLCDAASYADRFFNALRRYWQERVSEEK